MIVVWENRTAGQRIVNGRGENMSVGGPGGPDPIQKFLTWYSEAKTGPRQTGFKARLASPWFSLLRKVLSNTFRASNLFRPDVSTLATVTPEHKPAARSVLFTGIVDGGFSFYTDYESEKGKELDLNPSAVLVFYWRLPPRQVRIDGTVRKLSREAARVYWQSRTRANQAAAAAVTQSAIISGREELVEKARSVEQTYKGKPIPGPDRWGGYTLVPEKIEFWEGKRDWLHERERYILKDGKWTRVTLAP